MRVVTPRQMREIDKRAIDEYGIPGIILMENAALQAQKIIETLYPSARRVRILAGCGNNGGDGFALARILHTSGKDVEVLLFGDKQNLSPDAEINIKIALKLHIPIDFIKNSMEEVQVMHKTRTFLSCADLIVDAMFGTGLSKPLQGHYKTAVDMLNDLSFTSERKIPVVSLDIPSGIDGENGDIQGTAVLATDTVAFGYPKLGHYLYPGKMHTGKLHVVSISLPPDSTEDAGVSVFTLNQGEAAFKLKKRLPWGHKGTFGKVAAIAGSTGMTGAACLTGLAALKSGAGIVTVAVASNLNPILENKLTEVMTYPLKDTGQGTLSRDCISDLPIFLADKDVLAIGPGLGKGNDVYDILEYILTGQSIPIVLDADGLNHISKNLRLLIDYKAAAIITPHPGEMARLTGMTAEEISLRPVEVALNFAKKTNTIVLLKGATSIVGNPKGEVYINNTGNCGMATAGSGDVLTGLIAGLIAQKYEPFNAAVLGAFLHGLAGDEAAFKKGQDSLTACDMLENIPFAIKKLRSLQ